MSRMASYSEFALTRWPLCSEHLSVWILLGPFSVWILLVFHWILFGYELASLDITFSPFRKDIIWSKMGRVRQGHRLAKISMVKEWKESTWVWRFEITMASDNLGFSDEDNFELGSSGFTLGLRVGQTRCLSAETQGRLCWVGLAHGKWRFGKTNTNSEDPKIGMSSSNQGQSFPGRRS